VVWCKEQGTTSGSANARNADEIFSVRGRRAAKNNLNTGGRRGYSAVIIICAANSCVSRLATTVKYSADTRHHSTSRLLLSLPLPLVPVPFDDEPIPSYSLSLIGVQRWNNDYNVQRERMNE
jgi:hypothetical protein